MLIHSCVAVFIEIRMTQKKEMETERTNVRQRASERSLRKTIYINHKVAGNSKEANETKNGMKAELKNN